MVVLAAGGNERGELSHVKVDITRQVELDRFAAGLDVLSPHRLAQPQQRLAQVLPGDGFGPVGPEQPGQAFAGMGTLRFDGQVGQQGLHFVDEGRGQVGFGEPNFDRTEQVNLK